ncbi:MAG: pantoate--beta-alanine ligase [Bacteroidota bacterium]|nr:pantoate--beta-alanine ligase [Bacteroidota bacterium]
MILFKKEADLRKWLDAQRKIQTSIGFIPTMGALHAGHISLVEHSKSENPVTVSSIFVNPTQFNDPKDFEKYPFTVEKDIAQLEAAGCDVLFQPSVREMYPNGTTPKITYPLGYLEIVLDGKFRTGHFQGVCMVVHRLLEIVEPDNLYLGQKDYQQCRVITKLVEIIKPVRSIKINICPTLREASGLAMSSRNMRLQEEDRKKATAIYQSLQFIKQNIQPGNLSGLKQEARSLLEKEGFRVDYIEIAAAADLTIADDWDGNQQLVVLAAAFLKEVRLIDNILLS